MAKTQAVNFNFSAGAVKKGTKVSESNTPELTLDSSYGKFSLNTKGMELMGAHPKSHVQMFDLQDQADGEQANRFYIGVIDYEFGGKKLGAKIGSNKSFNYSGVYNSILADDINQKGTIQRELMAQGLLVATKYDDGTNKFVATRKGIMELVSLGEKTISLLDMYGIEDEVTIEIFALGRPTFVDHTPAVKGDTFTTFAELHGNASEEEIAAAEVVSEEPDETVED